jgi:hypothetical protein
MPLKLAPFLRDSRRGRLLRLRILRSGTDRLEADPFEGPADGIHVVLPIAVAELQRTEFPQTPQLQRQLAFVGHLRILEQHRKDGRPVLNAFADLDPDAVLEVV